MQRGRPTDEQKSEIVKARVSYMQYRHLKRQAISKDCSISDYLRRLIDKDISENSR